MCSLCVNVFIMFINFVTILFWVPVLIKVFNIPSFENGANSQWVGSAGRRAEQSSEAETKEAALLWDPRSPMKFCTEMPGRWATVLVAGTAGVCFLDPNFWFWHVLAISYYSMICHEPEINVAKQLSWSYSILSNNRLQVQWGQGMAQKWSPSKRDGRLNVARSPIDRLADHFFVVSQNSILFQGKNRAKTLAGWWF